MTYVEMQNEVLRLNNHIKEWVSFVKELKDENTELKARLQELQNKIDNGLRVEVDFRGRDNLLPVVELADEDCTRFDEYGTYVGKVVIEE